MNVRIGIENQQQVIKWSYNFFKTHMSLKAFKKYLMTVTNWDISLVLVNESNEIMGVYLFGDRQISMVTNTEDGVIFYADKLEKYTNLRGFEGVLLAIDESIRNNGYATQLKDTSKVIGYNYIWGLQFKTLGNLDYWLRRRELVGETEDCYITAQIF